MDENWKDPDALTIECGWCGDVRPCLLMDDPYISELYPEDLGEGDTRWWCAPCYENRAGDI